MELHWGAEGFPQFFLVHLSLDRGAVERLCGCWQTPLRINLVKNGYEEFPFVAFMEVTFICVYTMPVLSPIPQVL